MPHPKWGILPQEAQTLLYQREWASSRRLKQRLLNQQMFPIRFSLKPPQGKEILAHLQHFQKWVYAWKAFPQQELLEWKLKNFRDLQEQPLPVALIIPDMVSLAQYLGTTTTQHFQRWQKIFHQFQQQLQLPTPEQQSALAHVLVDRLSVIDSLSAQDTLSLFRLLPQLAKNMGQGGFLRSLAIKEVDTKFVETHFSFLEPLMNILYLGEIEQAGGLLNWLDCQPLQKGWLTIRPLDEKCRKALGNMPTIFQMSGDTLKEHPLPARRILVVENLQSGLALPPLEDTIAVIGGGKNVAWMQTDWLQKKHVAYWGDIDSEGFAILSDVRSKLPSVTPLMMDETTLLAHQAGMVDEPTTPKNLPAFLNATETLFLQSLRARKFGATRLEQERITHDYFLNVLQQWVTHTQTGEYPPL